MLTKTGRLLDVKTYIPHPALQDHVLSIATVKVTLPEKNKVVVTPYPPTPFQSLLFYCGYPVSMNRAGDTGFERQPQSVLVGPQFSRVNIKVEQQLKAIRVDFLPGGLHRMTGVPMDRLFDGGFDLGLFFGAEVVRLNEQLLHTQTLAEGKILVETFLLRRVAGVQQRLPFDLAMHTLLQHDGAITMEEMARLSCLSLKQFERKSRERIGMNPKLFARILKFSKAYRLHEAFPQLSWTKIAYEAGYFDQMHMIRDFKVFAGVNPSVIEQELLSSPIRMQKDLPF